MDSDRTFYICPVCFLVCETSQECHNHQMIECDAGEFDDERRRPPIDKRGYLVTRAPRWYLEAVGWVKPD
jgi:hypothetical protein